jgi:predicted glycosyltransferase
MRLIVYSHDAFGLGNIRRMLAICQYLLDTTPSLSILLLSGSPVLHSFRLPQGLDYIKLPCLGRDETGALSTRYLPTNTEETAKFRADLIQIAVANFQPDLILVDKKPYGLHGELKPTLDYLQKYLPATKLVLVLRDILDRAEVTISEWQKQGYYQAIQRYYHRVLVVGLSEIFDVVREYQFPSAIIPKVRYCGYIERNAGEIYPAILRQELGIQTDEKLVLVTSGGGADGYRLMSTYLMGLQLDSQNDKVKSLLITGPEMSIEQREQLAEIAATIPSVTIAEFQVDITSYINAADLVISMAGYNTICEILSLKKPAIVVPRNKPVQEQLIRTEKMAQLGLFKTIHPDNLTVIGLREMCQQQLSQKSESFSYELDFYALPRIKFYLWELMQGSIFDKNFCSLLQSGEKVA